MVRNIVRIIEKMSTPLEIKGKGVISFVFMKSVVLNRLSFTCVDNCSTYVSTQSNVQLLAV